MPKKETKSKKSVKKVNRKKNNQQEVNIDKSLILTKLPGVFLIVCLLTALYFLFYLIWPLISAIFLAAILSIVFYPLYEWFYKIFGKRGKTASLVTCLVVVVAIFLPITFFSVLLASEGVDSFVYFQNQINDGVYDKFFDWSEGGYFFDIKERIKPIIDLDQFDYKDSILQFASGIKDIFANFLTTIFSFVSAITSFTVNFLVMFFTMFYFFKDGKQIVEKIGRISPLPLKHEQELFRKMVIMVKAIIFGVFLTAIAQGVIGGIGFAMTGIDNVVFWATLMAFFSIVPVVGTALVWFPAVVFLFFSGEYVGSLVLLAWGAFVVGSVDNILRTYFIGGKAHTYPLITFLVIMGGIFTLGLKGVIIGPLVLMILTSFLHIYEEEYNPILKD